MKTLYRYFTLMLLMLACYGCKKELNALPANEKVDANIIVDQNTAQIALNGVYYRFANAGPTKTDWLNHQIAPAMFSGYLGTFGYVSPEEDNMNDKIANYYWDESFSLLNAANGVIEGTRGLADSRFTGNRKKEIIAEARFLRSYAHFKLLSYYGEWYKGESALGALLRDKLATLSNIPKHRSSVKESYEFILADLDDVISNAPAAAPGHYVSKWAGMALKMRVLMCRGTTADYTETVSLANKLIRESPYQLEANEEDVFHKNGLSSKDVILGVKPQANQEKDDFAGSSQFWPGYYNLYVAKSRLKTLYDNDPRQAWNIGTVRPDGASSYFTKYIRENNMPSVLSETYYALRLTETYLLKAEAIVRGGGDLADAKAAVHEVQKSAGIWRKSEITGLPVITYPVPYNAIENASTPEALIMEIFRETVKNLVAEDGVEWLALLRLPLETVKQLRPTISSQTKYILPIPKDEFLYNALFGDQNPGYDK